MWSHLPLIYIQLVPHFPFQSHFYIIIFPAVPSAPEVPAVSDIRSTSCTLTWDTPSKDGGTPITSYIIERKSGVHWIPLKKKATSTTFQVFKKYKDAHRFKWSHLSIYSHHSSNLGKVWELVNPYN